LFYEIYCAKRNLIKVLCVFKQKENRKIQVISLDYRTYVFPSGGKTSLYYMSISLPTLSLALKVSKSSRMHEKKHLIEVVYFIIIYILKDNSIYEH
jgi:hypothetical protein